MEPNEVHKINSKGIDKFYKNAIISQKLKKNKKPTNWNNMNSCENVNSTKNISLLLHNKKQKTQRIKTLRDQKYLNFLTTQGGLTSYLTPSVKLEVGDSVANALDNLGNTISSITLPSTFNHTMNIDSSLNDLITKLTETIKQTNQNVTKLQTGVEYTTGAFSSTYQFLSEHKLLLFASISTVYVIYHSTESSRGKAFTLLSAGVAAFAAFESDDVKRTVYGLLNKLKPKNEIETQACFDYTDFLAFVVGCATFSFPNFTSPVGSFSRFVSECRGFGSKKEGLSVVFTDALALFQKALNYVLEGLFHTKAMHFVDAQDAKVHAWRNKVISITDAFTAKTFAINQSNYDFVMRVNQEGNWLATQNYPSADATKIKHCVQVYQNALSGVVSFFNMSAVNSMGPRTEPCTVLFYGTSGVGKSLLTQPMVLSVLGKVLPENQRSTFANEPYSFIYSRVAEHEYWDGYYGQTACVFDDFQQICDVPGMDSEMLNFIRASNVFPYVTHQADIKAKGNVRFTSTLIVATSNRDSIVSDSIREVQAGARRFKLAFEVSIKPEFTKNAIDTGNKTISVIDASKLKPDSSGNVFDKNIYQFKRVDFSSYQNPQIGDHLFSYDEVVDLIAENYNKQLTSGVAYNKYLMELARSSVAVTQSPTIDYEVAVPLKDKLEMDFGRSLKEGTTELIFSQYLMTSKFNNSIIAAVSGLEKTNENLEFTIQPHNGKKSGHILSNIEEVYGFQALADHNNNLLLCLLFSDRIFRLAKKYTYTFKYPVEKKPHESTKLKDTLPMQLEELTMEAINNLVIEETDSMDSVGNLEPYDGFFSHPLMRYLGIENATSIYWRLRRIACDNYRTCGNITSTLIDQIMAKIPALEDYALLDKTKIMAVLSLFTARIASVGFEDLPIPDGQVVKLQSVITSIPSDVYEFVNSLVFEKVPRAIQKAIELLQRHLPAIATVTGALLLVSSLMNLFGTDEPVEQLRVCTKEDALGYVAEGAGSQDHRTTRSKRGGSRPSKNSKTAVKTMTQSMHTIHKDSGSTSYLETQGGWNDPHEMSIRKVVDRNMVYIHNDVEDESVGSALFVSGKTVLLNRHYILYLKNLILRRGLPDTEPLYLYSSRLGVDIPITLTEMEQAAAENQNGLDRDLLLMTVKTKFCFPDIRNHFLPRKLHNKLTVLKARLVELSGNSSHHHHLTTSRDTSYPVVHDDGSTKEFSDVYTYRIPTRKGFCGSVLFADQKGLEGGNILGIHSSGHEERFGLACAVFKEDLESNVCVTQSPSLPFKGNFQYKATLPKMTGGPGGTKIRPSLLHGIVAPVTQAPAKLLPFGKDGEIVNPLHKAIERYGSTPNAINERSAEVAAEMYGNQLKQVYANMPVKREKTILTFEEAIVGIEFDDNISAIPRGTSAGYPYNRAPVHGYKGKEWYFGDGEKYDLSRPQALALRDEVDDIINKAAQGIRCEHIFTDCLKDELRSVKKVQEGTTRLISCSPLALLIVSRMYFLSFSAFMMDENLDCDVALGINVYSAQWHTLYRRLTAKGKDVIAGDLENFDGTQVPFIQWLACHIINSWYGDGPTNKKIRETLYLEVVNSLHVCGDIVYYWLQGLPSGHAMTTLFNCIYINIVFRAVWLDTNPLGLTGSEDFHKHVNIVAFGDDNILNVTAEALDYYNQYTIQSGLLNYNLKYTDADKSKIITRPSTTIYEATFLKRSFRFSENLGRIVAPLEIDTILQMISWTIKGVLSDEVSREKVRIALLELSLHDRKTFDDWAQKIIDAAETHLGFVPIATSKRHLEMISAGSASY